MELKELIKADMNSFIDDAKFRGGSPHVDDMRADYRLAHYAHQVMCEKLAVARSRGRGGWWNPDECSIDLLRQMLADHVIKGDMRDVMILAAMIYVRECIDGQRQIDQTVDGTNTQQALEIEKLAARDQLKALIREKVSDGMFQMGSARFKSFPHPKSGNIMEANTTIDEFVDGMPDLHVSDHLGMMAAEKEGRCVTRSEAKEVLENWLKIGEPDDRPSNRDCLDHLSQVDMETITSLVSHAILGERCRLLTEMRSTTTERMAAG